MLQYVSAVVLLSLALFNQVESGCFCGLKSGKDVCHQSADCTPMVVRPQVLPKIDFIANQPQKVCKIINPLPGLQAMKPLGDLCSCKRTIVTPALIPRPACAKCGILKPVQPTGERVLDAHYEESHHSSANYDHQHAQTVEYAQHQVVAADPVSLSLATKMANQGCGVNEEKLYFGFRKLPKEIKVVKKIVDVPEENLHSLNGDVVELKKVSCKSNLKSVDEEAAETLVDEEFLEDEVAEDVPVKKLTYGDLGFRPARVKTTKFSTIQGSGAVSESRNTKEETNRICKDGFVSGKLVVRNIPQPQVYQPPTHYISPCDSGEETQEKLRAIPAPYPAFQYSSSSRQNSQSSASSCHQSGINFSNLEEDN